MSDHRVMVGSFGPGYFANMVYTTPATRAAINFRCSGSDTEDIPIIVNPRYDEKALVLNTRTNQQWGREERPQGFPMICGQPTQLTACAGDHSFDIFANKRQFSYSYSHRYDVSRVGQIQFHGQGIPVEPYVGRALPNYEVGKVVYIKGQAPPGGTFVINMVSSLPHDYKIENFAMHLSFRFGENTVVRNHRCNMQWAHEERGGAMPVFPNQPFSVTIVAQKSGFEVGVNGSHFCHFRYRLPLTKEMSVEMTGVSYIEKIEYC